MASDEMSQTTTAAATEARRASKWLQRLNDTIGTASRYLLHSQLVLRAVSEREIREQLPDLCAFADAIRSSPVKRHSAIRAAFRDPTAQWISRSAMESGASGFFCHLLLRELHKDSSFEAIRLVVMILLDAVALPCTKRVVKPRSACYWRGDKPKYYSMACSGVWETLLPFLTKATRKMPTQMHALLLDYARTKSDDGLVNCRFAQVAGVWRLLGDISDAAKDEIDTVVIKAMVEWLSFTLDRFVLPQAQSQGREEGATERGNSFARYYDLLLDKFLQDMHEFMFKSSHATSVLVEALPQRIIGRLIHGDSTHLLRVAALAAASCLLVKGIATRIAEKIVGVWSDQPSSPACTWVVGFVAHAASVEVDCILSVLHALLDRYSSQRAVDAVSSRQYLLWAIYSIVSRQTELQSPASTPSVEFIRLQERVVSEVELMDLQLMPLHWMEVVWRVCFAMTAAEIDAFTSEARTTRLDLASQSEACVVPLPWEEMIKWIPFRQLDLYPSVLKTLGDQFTRSLQLVYPTQSQRTQSLMDDIAAVNQSRKRRRLRRDVVVLSDEQEASRQNTLLLPEMMERICSFMSAKRLTRVALVCKAFARVATSERLWQPLYASLICPLKIKCHHGQAYRHDWRRMYQAKYLAITKLKTRQRSASKKAERQLLDDVAFRWHEDEREMRMSVTVTGSVQLCRECGCNQVLGTDELAKKHRALHRAYRCPHSDCGEALASMAALKQHSKAAHPVARPDKSQPPSAAKPITENQSKALATDKLLQCPVEGCQRTYKSSTWLQSHVNREHGVSEPPQEVSLPTQAN